MTDTLPSAEGELREQLRKAGFASRAVDAVWPEWWSSEAEGSISATTELRYTVARRLGLAPGSLFGGDPTFIWKDETRFKNLGTTTEHEAAVLASFAVSVGRCAVAATPRPDASVFPLAADELRSTILKTQPYVGLAELLTLAWGLGFPVIYLEVFPLANKRMHAVAARLNDRYALMIGRQSRYQAQVAYFLAHEFGHIALGHAEDSAALLDVDEHVDDAASGTIEALQRFADDSSDRRIGSGPVRAR